MAQRRIQLSNHDDIKAHQANLRKLVRDSYGDATVAPEATLLTKAEFDELGFKPETHEIFKLEGLHKLRQDLLKADATTSEEAFKKAVAGLKPYVVESDGRKKIVYVREKAKE